MAWTFFGVPVTLQFQLKLYLYELSLVLIFDFAALTDAPFVATEHYQQHCLHLKIQASIVQYDGHEFPVLDNKH